MHSLLVLASEHLVLVVLNSCRRGLNVIVVCPLRILRVFNDDKLSSLLVLHFTLSDVHGLVICIDTLFVAEGGVDFLLNDVAHALRQVVRHGVQKLVL